MRRWIKRKYYFAVIFYGLVQADSGATTKGYQRSIEWLGEYRLKVFPSRSACIQKLQWIFYRRTNNSDVRSVWHRALQSSPGPIKSELLVSEPLCRSLVLRGFFNSNNRKQKIMTETITVVLTHAYKMKSLTKTGTEKTG
jgi:hypothetical protein